MALVVDAAGILRASGVGDDTVDQILQMLEHGRREVHRSEDLQPVPAGSLGGAPTAAELQAHAGKAHAVVVGAMAEMVAGLEGYYASVQHFRKDVHETDATQADELTRRQRRLDEVAALDQLAVAERCTQQPSFADSSCEAPTSPDDA